MGELVLPQDLPVGWLVGQLVGWLVGLTSVCHNVLQEGREVTLPSSYRSTCFFCFPAPHWKCNFPLSHHVRPLRLFGLSVGRLIFP